VRNFQTVHKRRIQFRNQIAQQYANTTLSSKTGASINDEMCFNLNATIEPFAPPSSDLELDDDDDEGLSNDFRFVDFALPDISSTSGYS